MVATHRVHAKLHHASGITRRPYDGTRLTACQLGLSAVVVLCLEQQERIMRGVMETLLLWMHALPVALGLKSQH